MTTTQSRPEPMNASSHHAKVKVTLSLSDPVYVAGGVISGKMQLESRADLSDSLLGIGVLMVELYAIQEVNSAQLSATSTFICSRRMFQGPGLPPSNAVSSDQASELPLPAHHFPARHGQTTFFFQFPIPISSPSSINFGPASIKYEVRASASVAWRGDKRLVTDKREVKIVECWDPTNAPSLPQAVAITESGKIWAQATLTSGVIVGGESTRIDLLLRNHTQRWTSGVTVTLIRHLHLSESFLAGRLPPDISDVATQVEFRGPEYSVPPGIEGIASLVIDIPRHSRGVKGGLRFDDNGKAIEGFFEVGCTLQLRIDLPPGSEDTVVVLPLTIYHSRAIDMSAHPHLVSSSFPYTPSVSSGLLSHLPRSTLMMPVYAQSQVQPHPPLWTSSTATSLSHYSPHHYLEGDTRDWQDISCSHTPPIIRRSGSTGPRSQAPNYMFGSSTSHTPSTRLLPPPLTPAHVSLISHVTPAGPIDTSSHTNIPYRFTSPTPHFDRAVSPGPRDYPSRSHVHPDSSRRASLAAPIDIPTLPNPHDTQGVVHSPRPVPSPKHSLHGSDPHLRPRSDEVCELERMAVDRFGEPRVEEDPSARRDFLLDPASKGHTGTGPPTLSQGLQVEKIHNLSAAVNKNKTLPAPPIMPSSSVSRIDGHHFDGLDAEGKVPAAVSTPSLHPGDFMPSSTDSVHVPRTPSMPPLPPTPPPPMAAITPVKFPSKVAPADPSLPLLGADLGKEKDVTSESGLDALERRLLEQVGTRKIKDDGRARQVELPPHLRAVQPITIPPSGPPPDTVNDSAISSLTLADREGILKASQEREQDRDRDSDERTQHMGGGGGHSPSEDERDVRTQKGKNKSKHSGEEEQEDAERPSRPRRRRERKKEKVKGKDKAMRDEEGRKLRQEAKGRVAAWLGEIDASAPPMLDEESLQQQPAASHFVPITETASFDAALGDDEPKEERRVRGGNISMDKDVSASPNPRSSGFVTISSLKASGGESPPSSSVRRSSFHGIHPIPSTSEPHTSLPTAGEGRSGMTRSPSMQEVKKRSSRASVKADKTSPMPTRPSPSTAPVSPRLPSRLPRWPSKPKPMDPEVKYDIRSARGGKGGKVTQVASLWAAKASADVRLSASTTASSSPKTNVKARAKVDVKHDDVSTKIVKKGDVTPTAPKKPTPATLGVAQRKPTMTVLKRFPVSVSVSVPTRSAPVNDEKPRTLVAAVSTTTTSPGTGHHLKSSGTGTGVHDVTKKATKTAKATTVPAVVSSSHAVPMLSSTASLARAKVVYPGLPGGQGYLGSQGQTPGRSLPTMISETFSNVRSGGGVGIKTTTTTGAQGQAIGGDLAFGQARLRDLIKKYQG